MRNLELFAWIFNSGMLILCLLAMFRKNVRIQQVAVVTTTLLSGVQIYFEGYRWQMVLIYGMTILICIITIITFYCSFKQKSVGQGTENIRQYSGKSILKYTFGSLFFLLYISISGALPSVLPIFSFQPPTGSYEVGTTSFMLEDRDRVDTFRSIARNAADSKDTHSSTNPTDSTDYRKLMIQIWYPSELDSSAQRAPYVEHVSPLLEGVGDAISIPPFLLSHLQHIHSHSYKDVSVAKAQAKYPVLLFSHGLTGFRNQNTFQVEELASHGYIVVGIDHPYDAAAVVYPDQSVISLKLESLSGFDSYVDKSKIWLEDSQFVLDSLTALSASSELTNSPNLTNQSKHATSHQAITDTASNELKQLTAHMDMSQIGALGHSFGGATAVQLLMTDSRIKVAVNMDGVLYGQPVPQQGLSKPYLQMNAEQSIDDEWFTQSLDQAVKTTGRSKESYEQFWAESKDRRKKATSGADAYSIMINHANHMSFTDFYLYSPLLHPKKAPPKSVHQSINQLSLAFFDRYLKGDTSIDIASIAKKISSATLQSAK
jgi:predicted dienelactone hydrolase